jgi:cobalt-zinc-cadmium efflux system outer membrane protein
MPVPTRSGMLLSVLALGLAPIHGQQAVGVQEQESVVQLEDLVQEMLKKSPALRGAQYRVDAAMKRPSQVSTLPEPKISVSNFGVGHPLSRLRDSDFAYVGIGVSQEIPYPGKLGLAAEEARRDAEADRQSYRSLVLSTTAELKALYYDWFAASKAIEITGKNRELLQRLEQIARVRYSVGKGLQQDVLKAQVEQSTLAQQLELLGQRKATIEARITSLINSDRPLGMPADVVLSPLTQGLEQVLTALDAQSPRLKSKLAMIDGRSVAIERSKKEYRPDFGVSAQWLKNGAPFRDYYMLTAEVKVPLYFWRKQRLGVEESVARFREAREDYLADRQELVFQAKDLYLTAKTSERLLVLYQEGIVPQSALSLESAMAGYEVGNTDFLTLMNNFSTVLTYEMQYYGELAKHAQAVARLEALIAMPLGGN